MSHIFYYYIIAFLSSLIAGSIIIPIIIKFCQDHNLYDSPNARKVHKNNIPRLGGVCFLPAMAMSFVVVAMLLPTISGYGKPIQVNLWSILFFIGVLIIYVTGLIDDILGLSPNVKFFAQILAAAMLPLSGLYINDLYGLFGIHAFPPYIGMILTVLLTVFINNAMNLIDGIDGLSSSLAFVSLGCFLCLYDKDNLWAHGTLIASFMGILAAFFRFNVFGNPDKGKKIFMGDSGSLTTGYILAFLLVRHSANMPNCEYDPTRFFMSGTLLIVPTFDVIRVVMVRLRKHRPIFSPDKEHIHHKLMAAGLNQHQSLVVILALALTFVGINYIGISYVDQNILFAADIILWIVFHLVLDRLVKN